MIDKCGWWLSLIVGGWVGAAWIVSTGGGVGVGYRCVVAERVLCGGGGGLCCTTGIGARYCSCVYRKGGGRAVEL